MPRRPHNRRRMSGRSVLLAAVLLLATISQSGAVIAARSFVQIVNIGNADLTYEIRPIGGAWTAQKIAKGGAASFNCSDCSGFEMRVATGSNAGTVHTLQSGLTYQIFWNASAKIWDVSLAPRR